MKTEEKTLVHYIMKDRNRSFRNTEDWTIAEFL